MTIHYLSKKCPNCKGKMLMYYAPYCPDCFPKKDTKKNFIRSMEFIQHKYNIDITDYAAKKYGVKSSFDFNCKHCIAWENKHFPIPLEYTTDPLPTCRFNQKGKDWCDTKEGRKFFQDMYMGYGSAPDGACKEIPKWNWGDLFRDTYEYMNDCSITINWKDLYECCKEDWQREITQLFIDEFGKRDIHIHISW